MADLKTEINAEQATPTFLDITVAVPLLANNGGWKAKVVYLLETILGFRKIRKLFLTAAASSGENNTAGKIHCTNRVLQMLDITVDAKGVAEAIPPSDQGGAIVIANHPFGGADAINMCSIICENRRATGKGDGKILANSIVYQAPKFSDFLLPLKILKEKNAKRHNLKTLKSAADLVKKGGLLGVFPAGAVSRNRPDSGLGYTFTDPPWSEHIARIALKTQAPIIPIRYFGKTPRWFNILGHIYPLIRAALIPRILLTMQGQTIHCRAGKPITYEELSQAENPTEYIRQAVYAIEL